ncbi:MAG: hypothetical protein PHW63_03560 [Alphaproteobacteria bacterium]|nr:hypothetical protein [Alphaproteobacteria bacterium]
MRKSLFALPVSLAFLGWFYHPDSTPPLKPPVLTAEKGNKPSFAKVHYEVPTFNAVGVRMEDRRTHFTLNCSKKQNRSGAGAVFMLPDHAVYEKGMVIALRNGGGRDKSGNEITQGVSFGYVTQQSPTVEWRALANETMQPLLPSTVCTPEGTVIPLTEDIAKTQHESLQAIAERHVQAGVFFKERLPTKATP